MWLLPLQSPPWGLLSSQGIPPSPSINNNPRQTTTKSPQRYPTPGEDDRGHHLLSPRHYYCSSTRIPLCWDTGDTHHVVPTRQGFLSQQRALPEEEISTATNGVVNIQERGTFEGIISNRGRQQRVTLTDVSLVPTVICAIFSVTKVMDLVFKIHSRGKTFCLEQADLRLTFDVILKSPDEGWTQWTFNPPLDKLPQWTYLMIPKTPLSDKSPHRMHHPIDNKPPPEKSPHIIHHTIAETFNK